MSSFNISFVEKGGLVVYNRVVESKTKKMAAYRAKKEFLDYGRKRGAYTFSTHFAYGKELEPVLEMKVSEVGS